ncbi:patatin-like phospholipase family protein [soil metagenome]
MDMVLKQVIGLSLLLLEAWPAAFANEPLSGQITKARPKIGIALGGGGMRSAACVGVLKVLDDEGIPVDVLVGSGMGAVVGGLYSAGVTPNHIAEQFTDKKLMSAYITVPLKLRFLIIPLFYTPRLVGIEPYDGLYRGKRFATYLNKQVPETERNIEDLKVPFGAVAVNLIDGNTVTLSKGNLGKALQASAAIPALRKPVKLSDGVNQGLYVDGGVLVNVPVTETKKLGADIVIAINVDESIGAVSEKDFRKVGSVSHRVITLHFKKVDGDQLSQADYVIRPNVDGIGLVSTKSTDAKRAIESGEMAARSAIPAIRELIEAYRKKHN